MGVQWEYHPEINPEMGGVRAPHWVCDGCGKKIEGIGKVVFETTNEGLDTTGRWLTLGKGPEHLNCETEETRLWSWEDLDEFMVNLAYNAKFDLAKTDKMMRERREKFGL